MANWSELINENDREEIMIHDWEKVVSLGVESNPKKKKGEI